MLHRGFAPIGLTATEKRQAVSCHCTYTTASSAQPVDSRAASTGLNSDSGATAKYVLLLLVLGLGLGLSNRG